jgi:hypothetical protein
VKKARYRYSWLRGDEIVTRWDNSPHHPELETHPHHKHELGRFSECPEPSIDSLLESIEKNLTAKKTY